MVAELSPALDPQTELDVPMETVGSPFADDGPGESDVAQREAGFESAAVAFSPVTSQADEQPDLPDSADNAVKAQATATAAALEPVSLLSLDLGEKEPQELFPAPERKRWAFSSRDDQDLLFPRSRASQPSEGWNYEELDRREPFADNALPPPEPIATDPQSALLEYEPASAVADETDEPVTDAALEATEQSLSTDPPHEADPSDSTSEAETTVGDLDDTPEVESSSANAISKIFGKLRLRRRDRSDSNGSVSQPAAETSSEETQSDWGSGTVEEWQLEPLVLPPAPPVDDDSLYEQISAEDLGATEDTRASAEPVLALGGPERSPAPLAVPAASSADLSAAAVALAPLTIGAKSGGTLVLDREIEAPAASDETAFQVSAYPFSSFATVTGFLEALGAIDGVKDVRTRRFHSGRLDVVVEYHGQVPLEERLQELPAFQLTILAQGQGAIQVVLGI